jgi:hypothetical protein
MNGWFSSKATKTSRIREEGRTDGFSAQKGKDIETLGLLELGREKKKDR